jgi:uncharacterized membrane protein
MVPGTSRDLTRAEESFVTQVTGQLRSQPEGQRNRMVHGLRQHFLARPPNDTYARIERELGSPAAYAATLLTQAPSTNEGRPRAQARSTSVTALWVILAVLVVIVVVVAIVAALS